MATRKTGSRRIVVDGVAYHWRIRQRATSCQADYGTGTLHVAVELAEDTGQVLVLDTARPHPKHWDTERERIVPVCPSAVASWIRQAIASGWVPGANGPVFTLRVV